MQYKRGDWEAAEQAYLMALESDELSSAIAAVLNSNLAACELQQGRPREAMTRALAAIDLDGSYKKAHHKATKACIELGDLAGARHHHDLTPPEMQQPDGELLLTCERCWSNVPRSVVGAVLTVMWGAGRGGRRVSATKGSSAADGGTDTDLQGCSSNGIGTVTLAGASG